ncbi:hypothetical protein GDO86_017436 [Hymenochirus boettgeri]|uniref:Uncharacterized protein n=1 Tax=Hymenochirus boettgeri TaxID=247094 RepID=A0A8T2IQ21_9PIPI|nr:hypothetical protein GDO86_017436 [Hymenochirus boettgeri]KAG8433144.1 hypothetical protein GDO86_017436 [Hymenochirus boettgeri]
MGRLDEQAKHRVVILRKAGLSFRKIKKVLELDNIKVTPQAIYQFLKRSNVEPERSQTAPRPQNVTPNGQSWGERQPWNLYQQNGEHRTSVENKLEPGHGVPPVANKDEGIKIVSVTSLSKGNHAFQMTSSNPIPVPQGQTTAQAFIGPHQSRSLQVPLQQHHGRARTPVPAPRNPALLVTKKIVDRAINLQKKVNVQNGVQMLVNGTPYPAAIPAVSRPQNTRPVQVPSLQVKDACIQTALSFCPQRAGINGEQLDSIKGEINRLTQAVQTLMDRQSRWEQIQQRQQQNNHQEVLQQIQQLGTTLSAKLAHNSGTYSGDQVDAPLPDFGHFKMELL